MGQFDDDALYQPGGSGLIKFPEQIFWSLQGDKRRAEVLRGAALQVKQGLDRGNVNGIERCSARRSYEDGTIIDVQKEYNFYKLNIFCPVVQEKVVAPETLSVPELLPGQFFYIPGCIGRYSFTKDSLQNETPPPLSKVPSGVDTTNTGNGVTFLTLKDAGLPAFGTSPDGTISRTGRVCYLESADPDSGYSGARLNLSAYHIPESGPFSISCIVRLRKAVVADYSDTQKTKALANGYEVYNPVKPRFLTSSDGLNWTTACPGSLAPLVGYKIPSKFSKHWTRFTFPWPDYNNDFVQGFVDYKGFLDIATVCYDEPLLQSDYSPLSPYWDKVSTGTLESISGDITAFSESNTAMDNSAVYESTCTFVVDGNHVQADGTRAVRMMDDGSRRYGFVASSAYDAGTSKTTLVIQDYQYRIHMGEVGDACAITFGQQPFPVSHPQGCMTGTNFLGMCWYNGDRILAGKITDFETEYDKNPVVSDPLPFTVWHHVVMTYAEDGTTKLYVTELWDKTIYITNGESSSAQFATQAENGDYIKVSVGADDWSIIPDSGGDAISQFSFSSDMDIALPRFCHRELSREEARLLLYEAFHGVFVADDAEAGQLIAQGNIPVTV